MSPRFDDDPFDQQAAVREWARAQRPNDTRAAAVERGEIIDPPPGSSTTSPAPAQTRRPASPGVVSKLGSSAAKSTTKAGGSVAGVLIGFVAYALFLAYLRQGPAGPAMWIRAKFFNETGDTAGTGTTLTAPIPAAAGVTAGAATGTYPSPSTAPTPAPATPSTTTPTTLPRRP